MISLTISLKETDEQIKAAIIDSLMGGILKRMKRTAAEGLVKFREIIEQGIKGSPEYKAIIPGGRYHSDIGVPDIEQRLQTVIFSLANAISFNAYQNKKGVYLEAQILDVDLERLISLPEAIFITEKSGKLEWLRWLLLEGDRHIILGYNTYIKPQYSRTNLKIMVETKRVRGWRVPPEISGTANDNFLTRSLENISPLVESFMNDILDKAIDGIK